jgi:fucose permease
MGESEGDGIGESRGREDVGETRGNVVGGGIGVGAEKMDMGRFVLDVRCLIFLLCAGGVAQMLLMWDGQRAKEPLFQAIHLTWTCGASLAPVLVKPFLVESRNGTGCVAGNVSGAAIENGLAAEMAKQSEPTNGFAEVSANSTGRNLTEAAEAFESGCVDVTFIRYAYLLVASIILVVALFYVALYCLLGHHLFPRESRATQETSATKHSRESKAYRFGFYALTAVFCVFLSTLEVIGTSYLSLFVVNIVGWSVQDGATLTVVFWACGAGVRVLSIPLSYVIPPRLMLAASLTFICAGSVMLVFIRALGDVLIYVAVAFAGIGMSNAFPNTMLWLSSLLPCPSTLASIAFTFAHAGMVTCYLLFGMLGRHYGDIVYAYMAVAEGCVLLFLFLVMNLYARAGAAKQQQEKLPKPEVIFENKCEVFVTAL